jgi:formylglycine-generating enzyme required for sulfatase activity
MEWTAAFTDLSSSGRNWLELTPATGVILNPTGTVDIVASVAPAASQLDPGTYVGELLFTSVLTGATARRGVLLDVGAEAFSLAMVQVPPAHVQPGGPDYLFRIGRFEVTNAEFIRFLNDAKDHPDDGRGAFLVHETDTGIVRLPGDETVLFDARLGNAISYADSRYVVAEADGLMLPVVGVSWYGAVKFCNWMTLTQGMSDPDQRVYHEGPSASDWYALAQPLDLLAFRGFRLPMDAQALEPSPYNEWFKAAAWLDTIGINAVYGFGRDALTNADANFRDSGDPHEPGPAPVGYFDGVSTLTDGASTDDTSNGYGLYDMTGNVAEWTHDLGNGADERGLRGGHFDSLATSSLLRNDGRGSAPADVVLAFVGFRVVQVIEPVDLVVSQDAVRTEGYVGGPYAEDREGFTIRIVNSGAHTVDDFTIVSSVGWLELDGVAPGYLPAGGVPVDIRFRIAATATDPGLSPAPPGRFARVPAEDVQADGPDYDYWIGRTEISNAQFAAFLNAARANALTETPDARSHHMYFDLDSGNVYINHAEMPDEGVAAPSNALTTLLYDAACGYIDFTGDTFTVEAGFDTHPVVGVSWYGAVKYCNWLTLDQGIPASLRAYHEAASPDLGGWHPAVVDEATWLAGPLSDAARRVFVEEAFGYRLPMDDNTGGAAPYNEWYKAASRQPADENREPVFDARYGFGRDGPLSGVDANYLDSGDTPADGTTPVAYFDGSHALYSAPSVCFPPIDPMFTTETENGYGLYDATGNLAEWTQDFFGTDSTQMATRGGNWRDPVASPYLETTGRAALPPESTTDHTGFRVVRGTGHVGTITVTNLLTGTSYQQHFVLDLHEPFQVEPGRDVVGSGVYGDTPAGINASYAVTNRSALDMDWTVDVNEGWVDVTERISGEVTGTLAGAGSLTIDVATNDLADELGPGVHTATISFDNVSTGYTTTRLVTLDIEPPILVTAVDPDPQTFSGIWGGPFDQPATRTYRLAGNVDFDLLYEVRATVPWLTVEPSDPAGQLAGTLVAGSTIAFTAYVNGDAEAPAVGTHTGSVSFVITDPGNAGLTDSVEQLVTLIVEEPVLITQAADPWIIDPNPDPDLVPPMVYTLANNLDAPIEVSIETDASWLDLTESVLEVLPGVGQERSVAASLNDEVWALIDGEYVATVQFEDTVTGIFQCRTVELSIVEALSVTPFDGLTAAGVAGGPITPAVRVYRLTNVARDVGGPIQWEASTQSSGADWVLFNGAVSAGGWLDDGASTTVVVSIDAAQTATLPAGLHEAMIEFAVLPDGESTTRPVSLTLVVPRFNLAESAVPASIVQNGGPDYPFRMATYHTTNAEFVAFLNDAMANLGTARGQYMFFDTSTGDVYVHSSAVGAIGADPEGRTVKMFSPAVADQVEFSANAYRVRPDSIDYALHPVTGVSWYGAVKYSNWLTIDQGLLPSERCYTEATDAELQGWHPVTISTTDWMIRDLNDAERYDLATHYRGFRLPMDDGCNNAAPATDDADAYNEWYKAASYRGTDEYDRALFDADYGFGRTAPVTGADANFLDSGDPMDNGTTPTGYFDGTYKGDGFYTNPNGNGFGLFDMSGNAYHWLQGRFNNHPDSLTFRTVRGGSWAEAAESLNLRTDARTFTVPALTDAQLGFRVVRTLPPATGDFDLDGDVDLDDLALAVGCTTGPGRTVSAACGVFDLTGDAHVDLEDFAAFQVVFTASR